MNYRIRYSCWSHTGRSRKMNQDNYICDGKILDLSAAAEEFPLNGWLDPDDGPSLLGVFDGMGGEQCGEVASLIAASRAAKVRLGERPLEELKKYCSDANRLICDYADQHEIDSMGTTAALLAFTEKGISLCNIGDTKIFRFSHGTLKQISIDHYSVAAYGKKPPLSQNLGIPEDEMIIEPYYAKGYYHDHDKYLICSDGLTDMVKLDDISRIISDTQFDEITERLLDTALNNGGRDNITIIMCEIKKKKQGLFGRTFW